MALSRAELRRVTRKMTDFGRNFLVLPVKSSGSLHNCGNVLIAAKDVEVLPATRRVVHPNRTSIAPVSADVPLTTHHVESVVVLGQTVVLR